MIFMPSRAPRSGSFGGDATAQNEKFESKKGGRVAALIFHVGGYFIKTIFTVSVNPAASIRAK